MQISLGPVPYYWPQEQLLAFYDDVADSSVDIVYLGEVVCAKRRSLTHEQWLNLGRRLRAAGKSVVFSSLALLEAGSELGQLKRIAANGEFPIEANDVAAVQLARGVPFIAGASLNIYNSRTLEVFAAQGMTRWVPPTELGRSALKALQTTRPNAVQTEVPVWGRMPLAWSARCYTARHHDLPKDSCEFRCLEHPDGLRLKTREDHDFLCLNGTQVQSWQRLNLLDRLPEISDLGVDVVRFSADHPAVLDLVTLTRRALDGNKASGLAMRLDSVPDSNSECCGYWLDQPGMTGQIAPS